MTRDFIVGAVGLLVAASVTWSSAAEACSCVAPSVEVSPANGAIVSRNTRIWLDIPRFMIGFGKAGHIEPVIEVFHQGKAVPITERRVGYLGTYEVSFKALLDAEQAYEVRVRSTLGEDVFRSTFRTSDQVDHTPPELVRVPVAEYSHRKAVCCDCSTGDPSVRLQVDQARDGGAGNDALLFGVWLPDTQGAFQYEEPPALVERAWRGRLWLGHGSTCSPRNLEFPDVPVGGKLRFGVKALDLAGNASESMEVAVTVTPME